MELVKFEEFGLDEQKAKEITKDLPQIISERDVLAEQYNEVIRMDIEDPATAKTASDLRKLIKNNRTKGIEAWHKANKEYFLRGGQFVDAIKKKEIAENVRMEDSLEEIEKYWERKEQERLDKLNEERIALVAPYLEDVTGLNIAFMEEDVFQAYLTAKKNAYEAKIAEEKRIEDERLENERISALHEARLKVALPLYPFWSEYEKTLNFGQESEKDFNSFMDRLKKAKSDHEAEQELIRLENGRLKKEAEEKEKARQKEESERLAKEEAERKSREEKEKKEKEAYEAKLKAEREESERILLAERNAAAEKLRLQEEEARRLAEQIKAKEEAEKAEQIRRQQEQEAKLKAEEEAKKAPEKDKIMKAINDLQMPNLELTELSEVYSDIVSRFESFKNWAKKQL
jgi:hypothetical protein